MRKMFESLIAWIKEAGEVGEAINYIVQAIRLICKLFEQKKKPISDLIHRLWTSFFRA